MVQISQIDVVPHVHCVSKDGMGSIRNMVIDSIAQILYPNKYSFTNSWYHASTCTKMFKGISRQDVAYGIHIHALVQSKIFQYTEQQHLALTFTMMVLFIVISACLHSLDSFYIQNPNVIVY